MSIKIGSNISSLQAQRRLGDATSQVSSIYEKLSSGSRINKASDDAAGLAISESLNTKARVYSRGIKNLEDGISVLSIADGAIEQLSLITTRVLELAEQSANGTYSAPQREALDKEAQALSKEFTRIVHSTSFNGIKIFDGSIQGLRLQAGYGVEGSINSSLGGAIGTGTFGSATEFTLGLSLEMFRLADLNGDGALDIVGSSLSNDIAVLLGDGYGGFGPVTTYEVGDNPASVALGDVNGDGILDIVSADYISNTVSVLIGDGQGGFGSASSFTVNEASSVALGDLNGDGQLDIVASAGGLISVLIGDGNGSFVDSGSTFTGPNEVQLSDLNGDGALDIVGSSASNSVSVLMGNGQGGFGAVSNYTAGTNVQSVKLGDLNGDGVLDIVTANQGSNNISVLIGNGVGGFGTATNITVGSSPRSVSLGDLNGDGVLDIVSARFGTSTHSILFGNGQGGFSAPTSTVSGPVHTIIELADVNGDGVLDIIDYGLDENISVLTGGTRDGINGLLPFSLKTQADALQAIAPVRRKLDQLNSQRGVIGAFNSRLETAANTLQSQTEQFKAAESRIKDVDVAQEAGRLVRTQILQQVATAILAQANSQPQLAVSLLAN